MERWCLMDRCEGQRLALGLWTFSSEQVDKGVCVCVRVRAAHLNKLE